MNDWETLGSICSNRVPSVTDELSSGEDKKYNYTLMQCLKLGDAPQNNPVGVSSAKWTFLTGCHQGHLLSPSPFWGIF